MNNLLPGKLRFGELRKGLATNHCISRYVQICYSESRVLSMIFLAPTGALGEKILDLFVCVFVSDSQNYYAVYLSKRSQLGPIAFKRDLVRGRV